MALRRVRLFLIALLAGSLAACGGSGSPGGATPASPGAATPSVVPSTTPAWTTATCSPGSDPDAPGPPDQARPQFGEGSHASAAFDRQSGRVVYVDSAGQTWTFDVCTNTWEKVTTRGEGPLNGADLFYDAQDDLTYAISSLANIRFYDVEDSTWATVEEPRGLRTSKQPELFAMDPTKRIIYGYTPGSDLWAYDIRSNTWTQFEQGEQRPPDWVGPAIATFDPSVGRILLYGLRPNEPEIAPQVERARTEAIVEAWTFDPSTGSWQRVSTRISSLSLFTGFYFLRGTEMTYNEATRSTVAINDGVSVFDGNTNRWSKPPPAPGSPDLTRVGHGLVDDVVNGRVLVIGGSVPDPQSDTQWQDGTDVWAYDLAANRWTQLLAPQPAR